MSVKTPWYAALVVAILKGVSVKYPEWASAVNEVVSILGILWFGHVAETLATIKQNGNGNGNSGH